MSHQVSSEPYSADDAIKTANDRKDGAVAANLLNNTGVLILAQGTTLLVGLVATPFLVHRLGFERYGLWTFVASLAAYAGALDLGLGGSFARFVAAAAAKNDVAAMRRIVTLGFIFYLGLAAILIPTAWLLGGQLFLHIKLSPELRDTAHLALVLAVASFCCAAAGGVLGALLTGLGRAWQASLISLMSRIGFFSSAIAFVSLGAGIYGVLMAGFVQSAVGGLGFLFAARRLVGTPVANPLAHGVAEIRELLSFSGWLQVNNISTLINDQADRLIIGAWVSVRDVGFYDIASRLAMVIRIIPLTALVPLLPVLTRANELRDNDAFQRIFRNANRLISLMTFALGGFALAACSEVVEVWLGSPSRKVVVLALILFSLFVVDNLTAAATMATLARGRPRLVTEFGVVATILNVIATIILVQRWGLYGVLFGTVIGSMVADVYFLIRLSRSGIVGRRDVVGGWLVRLAAATSFAGVTTYGVLAALPGSATSDRLYGCVTLLGAGVAYTTALAVGLALFRFFTAADLAALRTVLPRRLDRLSHTATVGLLFGINRGGEPQRLA